MTHAILRLLQNYRTVLTGGFTVLLVIALIGGSLLVFFGSRVQDDIQQVQGSYAEGVMVFGQIETDVNLLRVYIRDEILTASETGHRSLRPQIDSMMQRIDHMLTEYEPYVRIPEERENYEHYVSAFEQYKIAVYKVLSLAPTMDRAHAMDLIVENLSAERNRLDEAAENLSRRRALIADAIDRDVDTLRLGYLWRSISILALSILIGGFIYRFVLNTIKKYIEGLTKAQQEKNEILEILTERQNMVEKLMYDMESSVEDERKRFSQELHDAIGHGLTISILNVESALLETPPLIATTEGYLKNALESMKEVLAETKRISYELRPPLLDDFGLGGAIKQLGRDFQKKTGIAINILIDENIPHLPSKQEISLYRIVQESLTNIEKHSGASNVTLQLIYRSEGVLALSVIDDGRGFSQTETEDDTIHLGMRNMRERINLMNGTMVINSDSGKGVEIIIEVPFNVEVER